ncbi:deoxyribodipyrimidine photo-lyase [Aureimonas fodinaquatilis]|uniref:Deoxyribodipyrimidine photo-lyase n=1 Tax=Aureimonas fodinaquatilis TaxID=2565783 RepID=A0A5B0E4K8_9HYPH|nr:deoxyribodipyrimidine photo-lyase [Aureimonas fodinaquatilis]KAA0972359.1 deoxyribodipyrimidine photo-lyase [Aureimonas fodinaquatilis]
MTSAIFWLTRDFRFADNEALAAAAAKGKVQAVFIVDKALEAQGSASRWRLQKALETFGQQWQKRTGENLTVLQGEAEDLLPKIAASIDADVIHQTDWPAPQMRATQERVLKALEGTPCKLVLHKGHLLHKPGSVRTGTGGVYRVYTPFARAARAIGPDHPVAEPGKIAALPALKAGISPMLARDMHTGAAVLQKWALPAGEVNAAARLEAFFDDCADYPKNRDRPDIEATTNLSEHLAVGEISPRWIWSAAEARSHIDPAASAGIDKFLSEILWREFAWNLLVDFPQMPERAWSKGWDNFNWRGDNAEAEAWRQGQTGISLVDAGLREMRVTGRMHNRVRMVVGSWLTKNILTDWRLGQDFFADSLTDWDPASNAMNWQWVAGCGPDASPYFRIFNPVKQADTFDPKGHYRARWLAGWNGKTTPEAAAYFDALPGSWQVSRQWKPDEVSARLQQGRTKALAAYEQLRNDAKP